jgi:hypothetical protein
MQLPRRVPWASLAELDQLCSYIYARDVHDSSRDLAIERVCIPPMCKIVVCLTRKKKALRVEIHDAFATRTRISSFYLGRRPTRQRLRCRLFFLSVSATELRHRAHPSRQRPRRSTPIGDVRAFHTLHRRSDRPPSLARRAAACRDARGPTES